MFRYPNAWHSSLNCKKQYALRSCFCSFIPVLCGGTHGNEMSGVFLVRHWMRDPSELQRSTFHAVPFLGNPRATEQCRRYIDRDLNRTFTRLFLSSKVPDTDLYEVQRAQEINQTFGPKSSSQAYDLMLDLHNTTANMGSCLIVDSGNNLLAMHMCNYIQTLSHPSLSAAARGRDLFPLELGPQPQGVARADLLAQMRSIVACALDFIEEFNQGMLFPALETEAYKVVGFVDFPRYPNGEISAAIHPNLQDKDFQPLKSGDPIFQTVSGEDILYEGDKTTYPVFINEAAYYEKRVAFIETEKCTVSHPALQKSF
uniref:N-acyl-aromatic-L-amino acid amidohydrolase n=1 Tax=Varanus komodoensis TaxID=61221 RepID=A0A8D2LQX8_VARKO